MNLYYKRLFTIYKDLGHTGHNWRIKLSLFFTRHYSSADFLYIVCHTNILFCMTFRFSSLLWSALSVSVSASSLLTIVQMIKRIFQNIAQFRIRRNMYNKFGGIQEFLCDLFRHFSHNVIEIVFQNAAFVRIILHTEFIHIFQKIYNVFFMCQKLINTDTNRIRYYIVLPFRHILMQLDEIDHTPNIRFI